MGLTTAAESYLVTAYKNQPRFQHWGWQASIVILGSMGFKVSIHNASFISTGLSNSFNEIKYLSHTTKIQNGIH
jgi:hypothetical protein